MRKLEAWLRRNGWRSAQLLALAWVAIELHRVVGAVDGARPPDLSGLNEIADQLGEVSRSIDMKYLGR